MPETPLATAEPERLRDASSALDWLACWDVLNEIAAPNAPNLSMNLWPRLFALGDQWRASGVGVVPDGRVQSAGQLEGFGARRRRPSRGEAIVITPPSSVSVLRAGYPVAIDSTALT